MTVPTYDTAQVQEAPLPSARQESVVSPSLLTAQADRATAQGDKLVTGGAQLNAVALKMKHEEDLRTVQTASAAYQEAAQNFVLDVKDKRTGAGAAGVVQDFDKFHREQIEKIAPTLANPEQQQAFATMAGRARLALRHDLGSFQITEGRKAGDDAFNADVTNAINLGAASITDDAAMVARDALVGKIAAYSAVRNMDEAQTQALQGRVLTDFHKQRIQQLVADPNTQMQAQAYYQAHEQEIDGAQRAEIGGFAKKATATAAGSTAAESVWSSMGPKNGTEPVNIFDMETKIRTELKGNDAAIEAGIKSLRERDAAFKSQRVEQAHALEASVNQQVLNGKFNRSSPDFIALSQKNPQAARSIEDYVQNKAVRAESLAAARESRAYTNEARAELRLHKDTLDVAMRIQNPDVLAGMSRDDVINLAPKIGIQSTKEALAKWEVITKNGAALSEAKIDDQQFKMFAQRAGLDITPKQGDDAGKERLIMLRDRVERVLGAEQQARKKPLTREEKDVILQRELDNNVMQHNMIFRDQKVPALALPADRSVEADAYVEVGPAKQKVKLSEVPATFRQQATAARRAQGLPTSEQQMAELWLRQQGKLKAQ